MNKVVSISDEVSKEIRREAERLCLDINISFRVSKIRNLLLGRKPSLDSQNNIVDILEEKGTVYSITCKKCVGQKVNYIGETGRKLSCRISEHLCGYSDTCRRSPVRLHADSSHGSCGPDDWNVEILSRVKNVVDRKISEAQFIRRLNPNLNVNRGITYIR